MSHLSYFGMEGKAFQGKHIPATVYG